MPPLRSVAKVPAVLYLIPGPDDFLQTLFVGANDGKLHAFNALTGQERFAYVPSNINWNDLATLSSPTYTHRYFVDGELALSNRNDGGLSVTVILPS